MELEYQGLGIQMNQIYCSDAICIEPGDEAEHSLQNLSERQSGVVGS